MARLMWLRAQKFRAGRFVLAGSVAAGTTQRFTLTDASAGGTDTGVDNTVAGMFVAITPPASIPAQLKLDYSFVAAPGTLTVQLRNDTGGDLSVSGTWSYFGYTF